MWEILRTGFKMFILLFALYGVSETLILQRTNYVFVWQVWRRFRPRMVLETVGVLVVMGFTGFLFWQIPGLKYGWANLFFDQPVNILISPLVDLSNSASLSARLVVIYFGVAFFLGMPFMVRSEENSFRRGYYKWPEVAKQSVMFGLVHLFVGIPLAAAIALMVPGFFFGCKYKEAFEKNLSTRIPHLEQWNSDGLSHLKETMDQWRESEDEAVMVSTTYHTLYNTMVIAAAIIASFVW